MSQANELENRLIDFAARGVYYWVASLPSFTLAGLTCLVF